MVSKYPFKDNREYIKSLRFHQDQKTLSFVFHHAGEIQKTKALFWNLLSNNITSIFENEGDFANLRYMIFSPDEQYLIGYSSNYFYNSDSSLKIWKFK